MQAELGELCATVVVSWDPNEDGGHVHFEAFQCSEQCVKLAKEVGGGGGRQGEWGGREGGCVGGGQGACAPTSCVGGGGGRLGRQVGEGAVAYSCCARGAGRGGGGQRGRVEL